MSKQQPKKKSRVELTPEQFVLRGLETLIGETKKGKRHRGFHTVWSGFKKAFEAIYPDVDMIKLTKKMDEDGKIVIQPWKGGVLICPPGTKKIIFDNRVDDVLDKMGVKKRS